MRPIGRIVAMATGAALLVGCSADRRELSSAHDLYSVSAADLKAAPPVHLRGVVTYATPAGNVFFVEDDSGGIRVDLASGQAEATVGDEVNVVGWLGPGSGNAPAVRASSVARIGKSSRIPSVHAEPAKLLSGGYEGRRVALDGVLMHSGKSDDGTKYASREMRIRVPQGEAYLRIDDDKTLSDAPADSDVRVTGIATTLYDVRGQPTRTVLWATGTNSVQYRSKAAVPASLAVRRTRDLLAIAADRMPMHRVRLRGQLQVTPTASILEDDTGRIRIRSDAQQLNRPGPVDIVGFPVAQDGALSIEDAVLTDESAFRALDADRRVMTTAKAVHELSEGDARMLLPVQLEGVVTFHNLHDNLLFVQDLTDGIFVWAKELNQQLHPGDLVRVEGITAGGGFAPFVGRASVKVLGRGSLPVPAQNAQESAFLGHMDSRWMEMEGVVQSVERNALTLGWGTHTFKVQVYGSAGLEDLAGAIVRVQGVCSAKTNRRQQLLGMILQVPSQDFVKVVQRGRGDPFLAPVQLASDLMAFSPRTSPDQRARVRGLVTMAAPSGTFWMRDASGGVQVQARLSPHVRIGDSVDVSGLPLAGVYSVSIRDAAVRRIAGGAAVEPIPVDPAKGFRPELDSQLVHIDAVMLNSSAGRDGEVLLLQSGSVPFQAHLSSASASGGLPQPGTLVRVRGIYSAEAIPDGDEVALAFRLVVGSPADIVVLKEVSWWTAARLLYVILASVFVIFAAIAWVVLLRREVRARVAEAESAVQRAAAAELHEAKQKQILDLIARHESVGSILQHLCNTISELCPGTGSAILIRQDDAEPLFVQSGLAADVAERLRLHVGISQFERALPITVGDDERGWLYLVSRHAGERQPVDDEMTAAWVNLAAMTVERHDLHERLSYRASHDTLTGLANRLAFSERLESELRLSRSDGAGFAICYMDLDGFKSVNDTLGHEAGDTVLREVARRIRQNVRGSDVAARLGGDEFIVLMPGVGDREHARRIAEGVVESLGGLISASAGVSVFPHDGRDAEALLRAADAKMYMEKQERSGPSRRRAPVGEMAETAERLDFVLHSH